MANNVSMMDMVVHIDENLDAAKRDSLESTVREAAGVISVGYHNRTPHLMIVVFNPDDTSAVDVMNVVKNTGVHAEFTGG